MRGICKRCKKDIKSGKLWEIFDEDIKQTIPICSDCKIKYYEKGEEK